MRLDTIKKRGDFLAASALSRRLSSKHFILQMRARPADHPAGTPPRIGFTVTKKMGNAVARNRIKRRLRATLAHIAPELARDGHDYVLIARAGARDCPFADLKRDMEFAFSRIPSMKESTFTPARTRK